MHNLRFRSKSRLTRTTLAILAAALAIPWGLIIALLVSALGVVVGLAGVLFRTVRNMVDAVLAAVWYSHEIITVNFKADTKE